MRTFLRTGEFGPIQLGDSFEKLRGAFGNPEDIGDVSRPRLPCIWQYDEVEFHLNDNGYLYLIFSDTFTRLHLGSVPVSFDHWFFEGRPLPEMVEQELRGEGLAFRREQMSHEPSGCYLRLDSGVALLLNDGTDPETDSGIAGLFGFSHMDHALV